MKFLTTIFLTLGTWFGTHAQGFILPNGVVYTGYSQFTGYSFDVRQNSTNQSFVDYTGFSLIPAGKTSPGLTYSNIFSFTYIVDEGVRVFRVSSNAVISLEPILSQTWVELANTPTSTFLNGVPFYLALYTGYNPFAITNINGYNTSYYTGIYNPAVFGWVKLVNNLGVIQMLDGAMEYGGAGIYAGTQNIIPVPEPSEITLIFVGLALGIYRLSSARYSPNRIKITSSSTPDADCRTEIPPKLARRA